MTHEQFINSLLQVLQSITFEDISEIPHEIQHVVADRIEQLQDYVINELHKIDKL